MNKLGIFINFWEKNWDCDHAKYIKKASDLGFDVLEFQAQALLEMSKERMTELKKMADDNNIELTYSLGLDPRFDVSSADENIRQGGIEYLKNIVERVGFMDGKIISGVSYAGWGCVPRNDLTGNKEPIVERSVDSMKKIVKTAEDLSQAVTDSGFFPDSMAAYIKTGEQTGCLDEILDSLSEHYEQEQETSEQIRSAVTYPLLMLGMMGIVIVVLLVKVLPIFRQVFQQMGMEMNGFSSRLLNAGNIITRYSAFFLILAALLIGCILFLCLNKKGQQTLAKIVLHLPVLRDIPVALDYSRMAQGLALGQKSGLTPETSLALATQMISHPLVLERLQKAADLLNTGCTFSDALKESGLFGGMEIRLIVVAFQSGTADEAFADLSSRYQNNASALITRVISVIEPTIVIILSLLVGLVLLSVMMPLLGVLADIAM